MFCPKCGNQFSEEEKLCSNCGYDLKERHVIYHTISERKLNGTSSESLKNNPTTQIVFFVLAAVVLVMSLYGAHRVATGGLDISNIRSVGGTTLEEAYYQCLGIVYSGYAAIIRTIGIFFASILAYLGIKG